MICHRITINIKRHNNKSITTEVKKCERKRCTAPYCKQVEASKVSKKRVNDMGCEVQNREGNEQKKEVS